MISFARSILLVLFALNIAACGRPSFESRCFNSINAGLIAELESGDLVGARRSISQGGDLNYRGCEGITPAFWYLRLGNEIDREVVEFIFEQGADPNTQIDAGISILELSASRSDPWLISTSIQRGADPNLRNYESSLNTYPVFALVSVPSETKVAALSAFVEGGADPFLRTSVGMPLIFRAINGSDFELVVALLNQYPEMRCAIAERGEFTLSFDGLVEAGVIAPHTPQFRHREEALQLAANIDCSELNAE